MCSSSVCGGRRCCELQSGYTYTHPYLTRLRLTGLLVALEEARSGAAAREKDLGKNLNKALVHADENNEEVLANHHDDLESLSLSRYGESLELGSHDLDAMSLSRVEEAPAGRDSGLSDASLSRDIPHRFKR